MIVCVFCGRVMKVEKNGFQFELFADKEKTKSYQKWASDKYKCPECGVEVLVVSPTQLALAHHNAEGYQFIPTELKVF